MPLGQFKDFAACVTFQKSRGKSDLSARKICGTIQAKVEGTRKRSSGLGEYQSSVYDSSGNLYLKYFVADDTLNLKGQGIDLAGIHDAIGKPFTRLIPNEESRDGDGHIWDMNPYATYDDHLRVGLDNSEGIIIDISDHSNAATRSSGAGKQIKNGRFATIKITDKEKAALYRSDPSKIPKYVSYGIVNLDDGENPVVKKYQMVHLQQVAVPANGEKATLYGACHGDEVKCMTQLRSAGIVTSETEDYNSDDIPLAFKDLNVEWDFETAKTQAAGVGFTSLFSESVNDSKMSINDSPVRLKTLENNANANTNASNSSTAPIKASEPQEEPTQPQTQQEEEVEEQKLKTNEDVERDPDIATIKMQLRELRQQAALDKKKAMIRSLIPREIYIVKGKFDEAALEKEVDRMAQKPWEKEHYKDYFDSKREIIEAKNSRENRTPYYEEFYRQDHPNNIVTNDQIANMTPDNAGITRSAGLNDETSSLGIQSLQSCLKMFRSNE